MPFDARLLLQVLQNLVEKHGVNQKNSLLTESRTAFGRPWSPEDRTFLVKALRVMRARAVLHGRQECVPEDISVLRFLTWLGFKQRISQFKDIPSSRRPLACTETRFLRYQGVHSRIERIISSVIEKEAKAAVWSLIEAETEIRSRTIEKFPDPFSCLPFSYLFFPSPHLPLQVGQRRRNYAARPGLKITTKTHAPAPHPGSTTQTDAAPFRRAIQLHNRPVRYVRKPGFALPSYSLEPRSISRPVLSRYSPYEHRLYEH